MRAVLPVLLLAACTGWSAPPTPGPATGAPSGDEPASSAESGGRSGEPAYPGDAAASSRPSPEGAPERGADTRDAMQRHDERAERARWALVSGDLPSFKRALDGMRVEALPGERADLGGALVQAAKAAAEHDTVAKAAEGLGQVGQACARCHEQFPAARYPATGYVEGDRDVADRMQRHAWAVEAMWHGLVTPSVRAWEIGAKTLADPDLDLVAGFPDSDAGRAQAHAFAQAASAARGIDPAARPAAFGAVIAQCAGCHAALGTGPSPEPDEEP